MRFLGFLLGLALTALGVIFLVASVVGNMMPRLIIGGLLFFSGFALILLVLLKSAKLHSAVTPPMKHKGGIDLEPFDDKGRSYESSHEKASYQREGKR